MNPNELPRIDDGGPAFPDPSPNDSQAQMGMTLLDYFAAKAMQGMIAGFINPDCEEISLQSYRMAKWMIARKNKL